LAAFPGDRVPDRHRRRINAFIVISLALQVLIPISYHLRAAPADERFAWRMYSSVRLRTCGVTVREQVPAPGATTSWTRVNLDRTLHLGWQSALRQDVASVVEKLLRSRCNLGASRVRMDRSCRSPSGVSFPPSRIEMDCQTNAVERAKG